jgi:uncharacterized repeat protein (TIGR01451 family)
MSKAMITQKTLLANLLYAEYKKFCVAIVFAFLAINFFTGTLAQAAAPLSGTLIDNRAQATYIPAGYWATEITYSNTVTAEVLPVESLTLTQNQEINSIPGGQVVLHHVLTNTGNTPSGYSLNVVNIVGTDDFNVSNLQVILDSNGNGIFDANETVLALNTNSVISLQPGQFANLLIKGLTPVNATTGFANLTLAATTDATTLTASNTDKVNVTQGPVVPLVKSASQSGFVAPGTKIDYTLVASNIGNAVAKPYSQITIDGSAVNVFLIRDIIPAHTHYIVGSLDTSLKAVNAKFLYRSPGMSLLTYQTLTNTIPSENIAEVAVAISSDYMKPNVTASMSFSVTVDDDGYTGIIPNKGSVFFNDDSQPVTNSSNEVILNTGMAGIGVAKKAGYVIKNVDAKGTPNGTFTVPLSFVIKNYGAVPLYDIQLNDVLEGADLFGSYTNQATPAEGQYTIIAGSGVAAAGTPKAYAKYNTSFTGQANAQNLLAPNAILPVGGELTVQIKVLLNPAASRFGNVANKQGKFTLYNNATVNSARQPQAALTIADNSVNGANPDPDNNMIPSESSPTPIEISNLPPTLSVIKTVAAPRKIANNTFELDYTIKVKNTSTTESKYVRVSDNLDCTFKMDTPNGPIKSWTMVNPPKTEKGYLASAGSTFTGYIGRNTNGAGICDRSKLNATSAESGFPTEQSLDMVDGNRSLFPGQEEIIRFTTRIVINPAFVNTRIALVNKAYAALFDSNTINGSTIVVASSAAAAALIVDPSGVVYNSVTRQPVTGAIVTLARTSCPGPITPSQIVPFSNIVYRFNTDGSVSMTTGADGAYYFFFNMADSCHYRLSVTPPTNSGLSSPSTLIPVTAGTAPAGKVQPQSTPPAVGQSSTYYFDLLLSAGGDVFNNHIPLDPATSSGQILLEKKGSKSTVELGDSLLYTLNIKNLSGNTLNATQIKDVLPRGFRLVSGSSRLADKPLPDPLGAPGASLQFNLSGLQWANEQSLTLTYVVQVGVGASLEKTSVNTAQAFSGTLQSNQSAWPVVVTGGVFSDEAYLMGKVYLENCNADKVQNKEGTEKEKAEEIGIPGVRLLLEDGTSVVTDIEGKYSLYGLSPITHVLKLDTFTLPKGSRLIVLSNRNSGKGDSQFVDLKKGELHRADFAVDRCNADAVAQEVLNRRKALEQRPESEGEALIRQKMEPTYTETPVSDSRSRPASGVLTTTGMQAASNNTNANAAMAPVFQSVQPVPEQSLAAQRLNESFPKRPLVIPLEEVIKSLDNKTGFIDLKDGDILPSDITNVRVKGVLGSTLRLTVNGQAESERRVGKKSKFADKQLEAWEYIGVKLKPGSNQLLLEVADSFGNVREKQAITVIAPGKMGHLEIDALATSPADFKTPVKIKIRLTDDNGVPVTVRTQLTLETDQGRFENKDLNPNEPGVQAFMEGGSAEFTLIPPGEPKDGIVRVNAGILQREVRIAFLPELRPLVGAGIIEGVLDFSKAGKVNLNAPSAYDAFERELRNLSVSTHSMEAKGRAAFYFKGTIKGEYLLTTAYDSDKNTKQRLFRDIQPAKFYPIYGDSSLKSFDAQSTQRFYLRIDKQKSYLMYGDFMTADNNNEARKLSQYSRSVTGVKSHYENGDFSATAFASRDSMSQGIIEIPANGTSGPYRLNTNGAMLYENSEKVEILVRDKNQPSIILETIPQSRFSDYAIDPISNEIFFKGPVASIDADLNPRTIRVTYEVKKGGKEFWMAGAEARLKVAEFLELGASYARDENPQKKSQVMGVTALAKLGDKTTVIGEVARTDTGKDSTGLSSNNLAYLNQNSTGLSGEGWAERIQIRHNGEDLKADAQVTHASKSFNNPTAGINSGRTEATANLTYKIAPATNLKGQAIYSKDRNNGGTRSGILAVIEHAFNEFIRAEIGVRAVHETAAPAQPTSGITPNDLIAIRAKLGSKVPWIDGADVYAEAEQDVLNIDRHMFAVGAGYLINDKTRLYGRYQFLSSISNSAYSMNSSQQNNVAVVGVESAYSNDGRLFSEYRIRDAINGRESQAAVGLRQTWTVFDGLKLGGSFEMTHAFAGQPGSDSTAITALAEYTTDPSYKLTGSLEARFASTGNSYLNTLGFAYKIDENWSALARNILSVQDTRSDDSRLWRTRQQLGVAWRQVTENRWNALARYEHRLEKKTGGLDPYSEESHIFSSHVNYQPYRDVITSGRYAVKWSEMTRNNISSNFLGHLLYGRVTWDFLPDWDVSLQGGAMLDKTALQYATGMELGYQAINDLWVSAGYNFRGFDGGDLKGTDYTAQGFYVRMRFKFDEGLFQ